MARSRFLDGFTTATANLQDIAIHYASAGTGPAILLLHGHPQTHVVWRKIAPQLVAAGYRVIAPDLRGYGDSDKPPSDESHAPYAKRAMAQDQMALMAYLGIERFSVVGHDRGGRVAHRLALDYPDALEGVVLLDIAPTKTMYDLTDKEFATRYFWWFFLIQEHNLPETMIGHNPKYFLQRHIAGQVKSDGAVDDVVMAEYLRSYQRPETIHAICEDYRASASIDLVHDSADEDERIQAPLLAIWGARSVVGSLYDVTQTWRDKARNVQGIPLDCGHAIPEEAPEALTACLLTFFSNHNPLTLQSER